MVSASAQVSGGEELATPRAHGGRVHAASPSTAEGMFCKSLVHGPSPHVYGQWEQTSEVGSVVLPALLPSLPTRVHARAQPVCPGKAGAVTFPIELRAARWLTLRQSF